MLFVYDAKCHQCSTVFQNFDQASIFVLTGVLTSMQYANLLFEIILLNVFLDNKVKCLRNYFQSKII